MRGPLDARKLQLFRSIIDTGSVTAAGKTQDLSQPAASRMLAALENELGVELFYRERGRLSPTQDGLALLEEVDRALAGLDRVKALADDMATFRHGHLRLVAPPSFAESVLPDLAAAFLAEYPDVHLTIDSRSVETAHAMIASRAVDAGFVKLPSIHGGIETEAMLRSEVVCVLPEDHALAATAQIGAEQLRGVPLILLGAGRSSRAQIDSAFRAEGVIPNVRIETHTIGAACGLAARGLGVALVNHGLARQLLRDRLVARPFVPRLEQDYAFAVATMPGVSRLTEAFRIVSRAFFTA